MKEIPEPPPNPRGLTGSDLQSPNPSPQTSLVEEMAFVADDIRQLYTDFGLRPYRVFAVRQEWSGGEKGRGSVRVVDRIELLPTPIVNMKPARAELRSAGQVERGSPGLKEISATYTEEQVRAMFWPDDPRFVVFIEVEMDARDGFTPRKRRFTVQSVPYRVADEFQWRVTLTAQDDDRDRAGQPAQGVIVPGRKQI